MMGAMSSQLPTPLPSPDAGPYWAAAKEGRLVLQRCAACRAFRFVPRLMCPQCGSDAAVWSDASGAGSVHSFTVVHRAPSAAFRGRVPYVIALIDLEEGPRMMANIVGDDARDVAIGDKVQVCFELRGEAAKVPQFRRTGAHTDAA